MTTSSPIPRRQIRALFDDSTITVYQAYSKTIAEAAVREQRLTASPEFSSTRMTWVKPSWCWMMYRSGYSFKDPRQSHILAIKMTHANFRKLLSQSIVVHIGEKLTAKQREKPVRIQWDPERDPYLEILPYRSIQIGIGPEISTKWAEQWVDGIEDVTEKATGLKRLVDEKKEVEVGELIKMGFMPSESEYDVGEELREILEMD
ncbi:MAG: hypothetical protein Q9195_003487 [Heterodermia aff. obscurata]